MGLCQYFFYQVINCSHGARWVYTLYHLPLNGNLDGGQTRKFLSHRSCCTTPLTPIHALTTELLLVSIPYPTTPAGLSVWAFTKSHQMNFTKVRKTAFTTELRWAHGQPFACVVSLGHVACSGISAVIHFFNRWAQRPARVGAAPRGSHYAHLGGGGGGGGTGLRKSRCAAARPRSSWRTYRIVCLRGRISTLIQIVVYAGAPLGPKKIKSIPPTAALILYISTLSFSWCKLLKEVDTKVPEVWFFVLFCEVAGKK